MIENVSVEGGVVGVGAREEADDLEMETSDEVSSPLVEGLLDEAGKSGRDAAGRPGDNVV